MASTSMTSLSISPYSARTSSYVRRQRAPAAGRALALSTIVTRRLPSARAYSKAARTRRSTPLRVFTSSWIAISSGVPFLKCPPMFHVGTFRTLAEDVDVDPAGGNLVQRAVTGIEQLAGPEIDVEVEAKPESQEDVAYVAGVGHPGISHARPE